MIKRLVPVVFTTLALTFSAQAQLSLGDDSGNWNIRPYAEAGVAYDDNVYRTGANEVDDTYYNLKAGLLFRSSADEALLSLSGGALYNHRGYVDEDDANNDSYGAGLSLDYGEGDITEAQLVAGYRSLESDDTIGSLATLRGVDRGLIQDIDSSNFDREVIDAGVAVKHAFSDRTELLLGGIYTDLDYDNPASLDLSGWIAQALVDHGLTDKMGVFGLVRGGSQEQDGDNQTADSITGQIGLSLTATDKMTLRAGVGSESYSRSSPGQEDVDTDNLSFSLSLTWQATDKLNITAGGYNGSQLSSAFADNAVEFVNAFVSAGYDLSSTVNITLRGVYRTDDYVDPVSAGGLSAEREDDRIQVSARVNYRPPVKNLQVYAEVSSEDVDSSIDAIDYTRTLVSAGLALAY